jgi:dihydroneopterin aldolase
MDELPGNLEYEVTNERIQELVTQARYAIPEMTEEEIAYMLRQQRFIFITKELQKKGYKSAQIMRAKVRIEKVLKDD